MPEKIVLQLVVLLKETFGVVLTRPGVSNMLVLALGWIVADDPHAITSAIVATGLNGRRHHETFHRFFSRGTWQPDNLGHWLFDRLCSCLDGSTLRFAIDDTLLHRKGAEVFGIASHLDAVRSTKARKVFAFGHCWVVLSALVPVPFSERIWALPLLFRLYRSKQDCKDHDEAYRKKTQLAREMLDVVCRWTDAANRRIEVAADSAYCNATVTSGLPERVVLFGAMRPDAVLTAAPDNSAKSGSGRPRKRGAALPKPEQLARDESVPWSSVRVNLYGQLRDVRYKTMTAQWYRACGVTLLRVVVVQTLGGKMPIRVFFCSDATVRVRQILYGYSARWAIEVFFREAKQMLGFGQAPVLKRESVLRVAPFSGLLYTVLVLWFMDGVYQMPIAAPPVRPWYPHKRGLSFADILRTARRCINDVEILVPSKDLNDLDKLPAPIRKRQKPRILLAG